MSLSTLNRTQTINVRREDSYPSFSATDVPPWSELEVQTVHDRHDAPNLVQVKATWPGTSYNAYLTFNSSTGDLEVKLQRFSGGRGDYARPESTPEVRQALANILKRSTNGLARLVGIQMGASRHS